MMTRGAAEGNWASPSPGCAGYFPAGGEDIQLFFRSITRRVGLSRV